MDIDIVGHVKPYRGTDSIKRVIFQRKVEQANKLEAYFRNYSFTEEVQIFTYNDIANETFLGRETIKKLLIPIGGGSNGVTLPKPGTVID